MDFEIVAKAGPALPDQVFHPIYAIRPEAVYHAYEKLTDSSADAVLMLGTGMPTLQAILKGVSAELTPALSCNLALARGSVCAIEGTDSAAANMEGWVNGTYWADKFRWLTNLA